MLLRWLALALLLVLPGKALLAQTNDDARYTIMVPEKPVHAKKPAHKARARYGSSVIVRPAPLPPPTQYRPPASTVVPQPRSTVPSQLYVPQTSRTLPNLPNPAPSGPHGTETFQDRAVRCAHQAGMYGAAAGDRAAYINTCVNQ